MSNLSGAGAPTKNTVGAIGDIYTNTNNGKEYKCVSVITVQTDRENKTKYEWDLITHNTGGESTGGISNVQSDWNQNNASSPDYIKNRPFYTLDPVETTLLDNVTFEGFEEWDDGIYGCEFDYEPVLGLQLGVRYTVIIDGVTYENSICFDDYGFPTIGSPYGNFDVYPFNIYIDNYAYESYIGIAIHGDSKTSHTISIIGYIPEVHQIDPKYIKDMYYEYIGSNGDCVVDTFITTEEDNQFVDDFFIENVLTKDATYEVLWNDESYICTARYDDGYIYIGNQALSGWGFSENIESNEPFFFYTNGTIIDHASGLCVQTPGEYRVFIWGIGQKTKHHKIDLKYMPDDLLYVINEQQYDMIDLYNNMIDMYSKMDNDDPVGTGSFSMNRTKDTTVGLYSSTLGYGNTASGYYSHAEGRGTTASESYSHAEGYQTTSSALASHAEGRDTTVTSDATIKPQTITLNKNGYYGHAEGYGTVVIGTCGHAEGNGTKASGDCSHTEGQQTTASKQGAHAEGFATSASANFSHAEGRMSTASGESSHAEGSETTASGYASHAEGYGTTVTSNTKIEPATLGTTDDCNYGHAEGYGTVVYGACGHAEGTGTTAGGMFSHAEGYGTTASGESSHAEGNVTIASAHGAHAEGCFTIANSKNQHVQGKYNVADDTEKYAHIVGNGTSASAINRSNAHTLDWSGNAWFAGSIYLGGTGQDDENAVCITKEQIIALLALLEQ